MATQQERDMQRQQEYNTQDRLVHENTLVVQPWLEGFAKEYNKGHPGYIGTCFYTDVTILAGPHDDYFWDTDSGKKLNADYQEGKISIYYVKTAGAHFIIENDRRMGIRRYGNQLVETPIITPVDAYFMWQGRRYSVPLDVAVAAKNLHMAQEYRGVLSGLLSEQRARGCGR